MFEASETRWYNSSSFTEGAIIGSFIGAAAGSFLVVLASEPT